jgi:hypothetical protein
MPSESETSSVAGTTSDTDKSVDKESISQQYLPLSLKAK